MKIPTFHQTVFTKKRNGEEYYGVIVSQRFYPVDDVNPGDRVELRWWGLRLEVFQNYFWKWLYPAFDV